MKVFNLSEVMAHIFDDAATLFFRFFCGCVCMFYTFHELLLDAPGGLPRLKDNENRAETYVFVDFFFAMSSMRRMASRG